MFLITIIDNLDNQIIWIVFFLDDIMSEIYAYSSKCKDLFDLFRTSGFGECWGQDTSLKDVHVLADF